MMSALAFRCVRAVYLLTVFVPVALVLKLADAPPVAVFFTASLAVVPAAAAMGAATEQLSTRSGPGIAGLLNVTFGNAPELIIAGFALADGPSRGGHSGPMPSTSRWSSAW